eukprot:11418_1
MLQLWSMSDGKEEHNDNLNKFYCPDEIIHELQNLTARDIYEFHSATLATENKHDDEKKDNHEEDNILYHVVVDIKYCLYKAGNPTRLLFSIYDNTKKQFVTEEYCLHLSENNYTTKGCPD